MFSCVFLSGYAVDAGRTEEAGCGFDPQFGWKSLFIMSDADADAAVYWIPDFTQATSICIYLMTFWPIHRLEDSIDEPPPPHIYNTLHHLLPQLAPWCACMHVCIHVCIGNATVQGKRSPLIKG